MRSSNQYPPASSPQRLARRSTRYRPHPDSPPGVGRMDPETAVGRAPLQPAQGAAGLPRGRPGRQHAKAYATWAARTVRSWLPCSIPTAGILTLVVLHHGESPCRGMPGHRLPPMRRGRNRDQPAVRAGRWPQPTPLPMRQGHSGQRAVTRARRDGSRFRARPDPAQAAVQRGQSQPDRFTQERG